MHDGTVLSRKECVKHGMRAVQEKFHDENNKILDDISKLAHVETRGVTCVQMTRVHVPRDACSGFLSSVVSFLFGNSDSFKFVSSIDGDYSKDSIAEQMLTQYSHSNLMKREPQQNFASKLPHFPLSSSELCSS